VALQTYADHPEWVDGPTSSITGGGAIMATEDEFARLTRTNFAVLLPSATYAMRAALFALGVRAGDEVIIPGVDWTANRAAVRSLGAMPVPVGVAADTLTLAPGKALSAITRWTRAIIVTHTHGVPADVPAITAFSPGIPVLEDFTGAFGASFDDRPTGGMGRVGVMSLGPGKEIDCGEGAILVTNDEALWRKVVAETAHPVRHALSGIDAAPTEGFTIRAHPLTGVLALAQLHEWDAQTRRQASQLTIAAAHRAGLHTLTGDPHHTAATAARHTTATARHTPTVDTQPSLMGDRQRSLTTEWIPVRISPDADLEGFAVRPTGAHIIANPKVVPPDALADVRLVKAKSSSAQLRNPVGRTANEAVGW
jgi:dTDP-4-amino-4,6-dideoxygalactose transaminase